MRRGADGKKGYHHGNLAESLLDAVDEIATRFGLEAVTLRACARLVGVAPSSAFRHYADKRALMTAFAARALDRLSGALEAAGEGARAGGADAFVAVGLAYVGFAIERPAFFRAMWREETIYASDPAYVGAVARLVAQVQGGFAGTIEDPNPDALEPGELLAWSAVHGLAGLFVDGPLGVGAAPAARLDVARGALEALGPALPRRDDPGR